MGWGGAPPESMIAAHLRRLRNERRRKVLLATMREDVAKLRAMLAKKKAGG